MCIIFGDQTIYLGKYSKHLKMPISVCKKKTGNFSVALINKNLTCLYGWENENTYELLKYHDIKIKLLKQDHFDNSIGEMCKTYLR